MLWQRLTQHARLLVRSAFVLLTLAIGVHFWLYVRGLLAGTHGIGKPYGVEGFLPVAALVGLKHWLSTGQFDPVHPAGLVIFLTVLLVSFLFAKAFCGWLCPVGSGCDAVRWAGRRALGRQARVPRWLDVALRGLKYLFLAAFLYGTQIALDPRSAAAFLTSPYNLVADVQMLRFLLAPGGIFLAVVGLTTVANVFGISLWCRYLCPYGALLGLAGVVGPAHVRRQKAQCVACGRCSAACPNGLRPSERRIVKSPECHFCGRCVEACPAPGALRLGCLTLALRPWAVGGLCVALFWGSTLVARVAGLWESRVPPEVLLQASQLFGGPR